MEKSVKIQVAKMSQNYVCHEKCVERKCHEMSRFVTCILLLYKNIDFCGEECKNTNRKNVPKLCA